MSLCSHFFFETLTLKQPQLDTQPGVTQPWDERMGTVMSFGSMIRWQRGGVWPSRRSRRTGNGLWRKNLSDAAKLPAAVLDLGKGWWMLIIYVLCDEVGALILLPQFHPLSLFRLNFAANFHFPLLSHASCLCQPSACFYLILIKHWRYIYTT
jgi:hypothetical protein